MALVVEDGSGVPDANSYVDEAFVGNYFMGGRLASFQELDDKDSAIVAATQLVDVSYEWKGARCGIEQGLSWPRDDVVFEGHEITGIPAAVKKAVCEAVWLAMTEKSLFSTKNHQVIIRERVEGAVDVSYAGPGGKGNEAVTRFELLDKLLRGLFVTDAPLGGSSLGSVPVERV